MFAYGFTVILLFPLTAVAIEYINELWALLPNVVQPPAIDAATELLLLASYVFLGFCSVVIPLVVANRFSSGSQVNYVRRVGLLLGLWAAAALVLLNPFVVVGLTWLLWH
ncbi:MAG: hypothetical protein Q7J25_04900 [Vicinamibacterales bacterium]|nr:hypothetical protein [Vicinamibacterales bacterium]